MANTTQMRVPGQINYWAWGSGDMLGAGAQAVITGWLMYFFTTFCGMNALEAGLILGLPRLIEAVTCPLIGYVSDNLRHSWIGRTIGRRKIFLMITIPLLPSFALIWMTGHSFAYYLTTFIFFEFVYTMFLIPWETLAAEMSKDYKEKANFAGARMLVAQASAILASYLPTLIIDQLGGKNSPDTFLIMACIFGAVFSFVVILVVLFTWERPYSDEELEHRPAPMTLKSALLVPIKMFADLFSTLRIKAFRQHLSLYLGGYVSQDIYNTAFPLFVTTIMMGATLIISQLMTAMYFAQLLSVMLAIHIVIRTGPVLAYRFAIMSVMIGLSLFLFFYFNRPVGFDTQLKGLGDNIFTGLFMGKDGFNFTLFFWLLMPVFFAGLGRGTLNFVPWSVYNYLPDIDEAVTGERREGIFAGVMTLVRKMAQSGAIVLAGWLINLGGFKPADKAHPELVVNQTPEALNMIMLILVGGPILFMVLGFLFSLKFNLNAKTHAILVRAVERLRSGNREPEDAESKAVVESLTGWRYDQLWGAKKAK